MVSKQSELILSTAREWVGTPWHHNQKAKGVGVDCVRFIEAVFSDSLGYDLGKIGQYSRMPEDDQIMVYMLELESLRLIWKGQQQPGDLLLFRIGKIPYHLGICNGDGLIHAHSQHGVIEVDNLGSWEKRLVAVFRVKPKKIPHTRSGGIYYQ